ncbi:MAG: LytTR family transcriptional regulator DNA-binding domain-containing protein [Bacteroidota bacterium]
MLKTILNRPYYFEENDRRRWRTVIFISLFVFLFLAIFQPFQLSTYPKAKLPVFLSFGAITFFVCAVFAIALPKIFTKYYSAERWTTGKEIAYRLLMIAFIGFGNTLYAVWMSFISRFWEALLYFEIYTFAVALFPILFIVFITEKLENQKHELLSNTLMTQKQLSPQKERQNSNVLITASNKKVALELDPQNIYYLKSEANYIEVIYEQNEKFEKTLLRNTLTAMEKQFQDFEYLFRCHKSYLVNLNQVERISGNAQGLKIHFDGLEEIIPVSRKYNEVLKSQFH